MKKILALVLSLAMMLGLASCAKKVEVPSKSDVKKAAKEEYDMDFKVDSEDISDDEKDAEWVLISKDGTLQVTVTWNAKKPEEFEFDDETLEEPTTTTTTEEATTTTEEPATTTTTEDTSATDSSDNGGSNPNPNPSGAKYVNFDEMNLMASSRMLRTISSPSISPHLSRLTSARTSTAISTYSTILIQADRLTSAMSTR